MEKKTINNRKTYTISMSKFLDWIFDNDEDNGYWTERMKYELLEHGTFNISADHILHDRDSLPIHLFEEYYTSDDYDGEDEIYLFEHDIKVIE